MILVMQNRQECSSGKGLAAAECQGAVQRSCAARAREESQRVTLRGRDAVMIADAQILDRSREPRTGQRLADALAASPLADRAFNCVAGGAVE